MQWRYEIDVGLKHWANPQFDLLFATPRKVIRETFNYDENKNKGRFPDEDSYDRLFGIKDHFVRLDFADELLSDIEVLEGEVLFDDVLIKTHTDLSAVIDAILKKGHQFHEWDYGFTFLDLQLDLGDSDKNGGVPNLIYWVLVSQNIERIAQPL